MEVNTSRLLYWQL